MIVFHNNDFFYNEKVARGLTETNKFKYLAQETKNTLFCVS